MPEKLLSHFNKIQSKVKTISKILIDTEIKMMMRLLYISFYQDKKLKNTGEIFNRAKRYFRQENGQFTA